MRAIRRLAATVAAAAGVIAIGPAAGVAQQDSATTLETVIVSVTRGSGRSVLGSPFALTVTRPDSSRPGQRHTAIDETLALVPGLSATNRNNPSQDPRISIRGFGARSAFGVRGIRVLRDGMPITLPDGQTPLDYISLESVGHVEIMRGAASALYGNASGGVIDLRSSEPAQSPFAGSARQWLGDDGFSRSVMTASGTSRAGSYIGDIAHTRSDGWRAHAAQRATTGFLRLERGSARSDYSLSILGLNNPLAENPGALTIDEMRQDARTADALSVRRNARKIVRQVQIGAAGSRRLGSGEITLSVFGGARSLDNPLTFAIVEVGRHSNGASARITQEIPFLGSINRISLGLDLQSQNDLRRNFATCADTIPLVTPTPTCPAIDSERGIVTLDQRELVTGAGVYVSDDIALTSRLSLTAGARWDNVKFEVRDRLITAANPDDSGRRSLRALTPIVGVVMRITPAHSAYANAAGAFETPTATELGNQPDGSAGINPNLDPQRSTTVEAGFKGFVGSVLRYDVAAYATGVKDELVPFEIPASNGRRYFRNAGRTTRRGAEAGVELRAGVLSLATTYSHSRFRFDDYQIGASSFDGNEIPGVPRNRWQSAAKVSMRAAFAVLETELAGSAFADDANSVRAPGYEVAHFRLGSERLFGSRWLSVAAGIQNVFDRRYAASIAVNAARAKYYEPATGRVFAFGASIRGAL